MYDHPYWERLVDQAEGKGLINGMYSLKIEVKFKVDVKLELYRSAYLEAMKHATSRLEMLWHTPGLTSTVLIRPQYDIIFSIQT